MCTDAYREALTRAFSSTAAPSQRQAAEAADPPAGRASRITSAQAPRMTAETVRAAVRPVVNRPALPRPPAAEKTEPSTAMPSTVPTWRSALEVPEAMPSNCPGA